MVSSAGKPVQKPPQITDPKMTDEEFWQELRRGLLVVVDAIERKTGREPRTAVLRKWYNYSQKRGNILAEVRRVFETSEEGE